MHQRLPHHHPQYQQAHHQLDISQTQQQYAQMGGHAAQGLGHAPAVSHMSQAVPHSVSHVQPQSHPSSAGTVPGGPNSMGHQSGMGYSQAHQGLQVCVCASNTFLIFSSSEN